MSYLMSGMYALPLCVPINRAYKRSCLYASVYYLLFLLLAPTFFDKSLETLTLKQQIISFYMKEKSLKCSRKMYIYTEGLDIDASIEEESVVQLKAFQQLLTGRCSETVLLMQFWTFDLPFG